MGTLRVNSFPVARDGIVREMRSAPLLPFPFSSAEMAIPPEAPVPWVSLGFLLGNLGHFLQRVCWQLLQIFSEPKVVEQRWQVRCTRRRIFFSTLSASLRTVGVHSPGSSLKPYLAKRARAFSSCNAQHWAAVVASLGFVILGLGLVSLMDCWRAAGTDGTAGGSTLVGVAAGAGLALPRSISIKSCQLALASCQDLSHTCLMLLALVSPAGPNEIRRPRPRPQERWSQSVWNYLVSAPCWPSS